VRAARTAARTATSSTRNATPVIAASIPPPADPIEDGAKVDLATPSLYLNRELTWLAFNRRVLHEAEDPRTPLLERVKFLAIASGTIDEFVMKRIGGLKQQLGAGVHNLTVDGRTPQEQITECYGVMRALKRIREKTLVTLTKELAKEEIYLKRWAELSAAEQKEVREFYLTNIFPLVTPQAMDPAHPFPFVSNMSLNLLVTLKHADSDLNTMQARVKVPVGSGIQRFIKVGEDESFVRLEDVMANNLDLLFPGMHVEDCDFFRVTRNADVERDEESADDLLALIETELRDRKFAPTVILQVNAEMPELRRGMLAAELGLNEIQDVFEVRSMLGQRDLMEIATLDIPELHDPPHPPVDHPGLSPDRNMFHLIRDVGSVLVHHPYESFATSVERFLREASKDPKVRAIKTTLYRTSEDSKVIAHLINAARNGKQVAVVVELKARFDEMANIRWAAHLESVGIHVTYGVVGLKTHAKVVLVVRQDFNGLRRYAHLGTGNYHSGTARLYGDLGLFTCDDDIGHDLTELFNYLTTGYKPGRKYRKLLPAPKLLKPALLGKIRREIEQSTKAKPGRIVFKMNALEDRDIVEALYEASRAGVLVDLIVRDTCRLRPGIPGLSDNIRVISIVGRFLEHARIYYFQNGGDEEYYIGSADLMQRNLESRVESVVPVEDPELQEELWFILETQLKDMRSAWDMQPDGSYVQRTPKKGESALSSQEIFVQTAERRRKEAKSRPRRKNKGGHRRNRK
jgi:polyphosphate kinase